MKNSIAENPYFVMEFLNILNTDLRTRSVFDYKTMKKANNNDVIFFLGIPIQINFSINLIYYELFIIITYSYYIENCVYTILF